MIDRHPSSVLLSVLLSVVGAAACSSSDATTPAKTTTTTTAPTKEPPAPPTSTPVACVATVATTLPGITVRVKNERCDFTLAQAAAGITIDWELTVAQDLPALYVDGAAGGAPQTALELSASLSGQGQAYCLCDTGLRASAVEALNVPAGTYPGAFAWDGKNWNGPSDTGNPEGAAFPEGRYTLTLHAEGAHARPDAGAGFAKDFDLDVTVPIALVK